MFSGPESVKLHFGPQGLKMFFELLTVLMRTEQLFNEIIGSRRMCSWFSNPDSRIVPRDRYGSGAASYCLARLAATWRFIFALAALACLFNALTQQMHDVDDFASLRSGSGRHRSFDDFGFAGFNFSVDDFH